MLSYLFGSVAVILLILTPAAVEGGLYIEAAIMMVGVVVFYKISEAFEKNGK